MTGSNFLQSYPTDPQTDYDTKPMISIIMPAYNTERFIGAAIQSVLSQSAGDWELLVIDDHSSDHTVEIVESFNDSRIHYIKADTHLGKPAAVRNYGVQFAQGDYLFFFDSDDILLPDALLHLVKFAAAHPTALAAYGFSVHIDEMGNLLPSAGFKLVPQDDGGYSLPANYRHTWQRIASSKFVGSTNIFIRKPVFEQIGGFNETLAAAEDMQIYYNLFLESMDSVGIIPAYLIQYRQHSSSLTKNIQKIESVLQAHLQVVDWLFSDPRFPADCQSYRSFSICKSYNYVAGVRLAQGDRSMALNLLFRALRLPNVDRRRWFEVCFSTFLRCLLPTRCDTYLKALAVDLRDGVLFARLRQKLRPIRRAGLSSKETAGFNGT